MLSASELAIGNVGFHFEERSYVFYLWTLELFLIGTFWLKNVEGLETNKSLCKNSQVFH